jgi:hypothetical protein
MKLFVRERPLSSQAALKSHTMQRIQALYSNGNVKINMTDKEKASQCQG